MLLTAFLIHVGGYHIVFWALRLHLDRQVSHRIDRNQVAADETLELKIPVSLPYPIYAQGFERVDGTFEHQGQFYRLVKHKFQNDTLHVICIRDFETRQLVNAMDEYVELTQAPATQSDKAWDLLAKLIKDYYSGAAAGIIHQEGYIISLSFCRYTSSFRPPSLPVHAPPPRA